MNLLQMQGGIINTPRVVLDPAAFWDLPVRSRNPCPIGTAAINLFAMTFLTREERHGMLFHIGSQLDGLKMSFHAILSQTRWPIFGLLARLGEAVVLSGAARPVDVCGGGGSPLPELRLEMADLVSQGRPVPLDLPREVIAAVERAAPAEMRGEGNMPAACALALSAAWAAMAGAEAQAEHGEAFVVEDLVHRAETSLRSVSTNYTHLDWLSTGWPVFKLLHRLQFSLAGPEDRAPATDLIPRAGGQPLRFGFNRGFARPDTLYIDIAADIIHTDLMRSLPRFFGMREASPREPWHVNFVYTSNDYHDLLPAPGLWRLRAASQRLVYLPMGHDLIGEKDVQCKVYQEALARWRAQPSLVEEVGGMPRCFELPGGKKELRDYASSLAKAGDGARAAYVRKPEGAWGGRGIEIRYGVDDLLEASGVLDDGACAFESLESVQCLGLREASSPGAAASEEACRRACCDEELERGKPCDAWNWRESEGCWVGTPRVCSDRNPVFLGGWRGGKRLRGRAAEQRAVVQRYVLDPVLYQLEGIKPPLKIKTDIRIYGAAVSLDPLRLYVSRHGYFRTGYLEHNYSTATDQDFLDRLMHVTHHIPKIETGSYHCPTAPSWGDPKGAEHDAGSGGSLRKWLRIAKEQNGLDPKHVWENIKTAIAVFILGVRGAVSCSVNPLPHACGSVGFHFFADLVVDSAGRAWLMEIHPTLAIKSHGLGDPEGGWVEVLTRETRQGSMGTLGMFFAGWADAPFRDFAERRLRRRLLAQPRQRVDVARVRRLLLRQRADGPGWGGESMSVAGLLAKALTEEHLACRLAVQAVLPRLWHRVSRHVRVKESDDGRGDPFGDGLRPFYRLLDAARLLLRGRRAPGDLRPRRCVPIDFNEGTVWDQPWERASRRFGGAGRAAG